MDSIDLALEDCGDGHNSILKVSVKLLHEADDEEESQTDDVAQDGLPSLVPKRPDPVPQAPAFPIQRHHTWAQWLRHHTYTHDRSLVEEAVAKDRRVAAFEHQTHIRNTKGRPSTASAQSYEALGKGGPVAVPDQGAAVGAGPSQGESSETRELEEA
eukprot:1993475-Amphidinium_carterae.1